MKKLFLFTIFISLFSIPEFAQKSTVSDITKDANNPLASTKSFSVHNIYSPSIHGIDGTMNTAWFRYAQPIGRVLIRASMPVNTVSLNPVNKSGLGDFNIFGTYILTRPTSVNQFGVGPILTVPTATSSLLGGGKWLTGVALAAYFAGNPIFQSGLLVTWQHSFAGDSDRSKVHAASIQPFFMWQMGNGLYLRSTAINVLDFENGNYLFPIGLGLGKIIKVEKVVFNIFAEPQYSIWSRGIGLPKTQVFIGINTQF